MERYLSANSYFRGKFGCKVYKLALDGGFTCPNRDGTLGDRGCIFCSGRGSGDFSVPVGDNAALAVERAKAVLNGKDSGGKYIAYFQSYTGTYAPIDYLRRLFFSVTELPDIAALSIGTRPDCLGGSVIELLAEINAVKPVMIELGLQTVHETTAAYIRRGYRLEVFDSAVTRLKEAGIEVIVHMIIGLPGESHEMIFETAKYIAHSGADGVKFQLLHVLRGTDLEKDYAAGKFEALSMAEYIKILEGCVRRIPRDMVIHRLTGDGAKRDLVAPLWSADKKKVLNSINRAFEEDDVIQGDLFT